MEKDKTTNIIRLTFGDKFAPQNYTGSVMENIRSYPIRRGLSAIAKKTAISNKGQNLSTLSKPRLPISELYSPWNKSGNANVSLI